MVRGGTHSGELWGIRATGRTLAVPEIDLCRIENGKVSEYWVLSDEQTFHATVGTRALARASGGALTAEAVAEDVSIRSGGSEP